MKLFEEFKLYENLFEAAADSKEHPWMRDVPLVYTELNIGSDPNDPEDDMLIKDFTYLEGPEDVAEVLGNLITEEDVAGSSYAFQTVKTDHNAWYDFLDANFDKLVAKYDEELLNAFEDRAKEAAIREAEDEYYNDNSEYIHESLEDNMARMRRQIRDEIAQLKAEKVTDTNTLTEVDSLDYYNDYEDANDYSGYFDEDYNTKGLKESIKHTGVISKMKLSEEFKLFENMWDNEAKELTETETSALNETWGFLVTERGMRAKEQLDGYDDTGVQELRDYIKSLQSWLMDINPSPLTMGKINEIRSKIRSHSVDLHWLEDYMEENDLEARIAEFREVMDESIDKKHNIATKTTTNEQINLNKTNKMTKSELRQMIREMLYEELKLV